MSTPRGVTSSPSKNFYGHSKVKFTQSCIERVKRRKTRKCVNVSSKLRRPPPPKPMARQPFQSGLKFRGHDTSMTRTYDTTLTHTERYIFRKIGELFKTVSKDLIVLQFCNRSQSSNIQLSCDYSLNKSLDYVFVLRFFTNFKK